MGCCEKGCFAMFVERERLILRDLGGSKHSLLKCRSLVPLGKGYSLPRFPSSLS